MHSRSYGNNNTSKAEASASAFALPRCIQHIFDKDSVSLGRIVDEDVGDGADELAILYDRAAAHVRCSLGTT